MCEKVGLLHLTKELNDQLVSVYLYLLKQNFPHIAGLQNTLLQQRQNPAIHHEDGQMLLQIIHIRGSHWATIQIMNGNEILLYDSAYSTVTLDTVDVISKLIHCTESTITIHIMNVSKQAGTMDCALFAMATVTSLALGDDPVTVVYDQQQLRSHFLESLVTRNIKAFPLLKSKRVASRYKKSEKFQVYCYCRMRYDGSKMICCDSCEEWYHLRCIKTDSIDVDKWFCDNCV